MQAQHRWVSDSAAADARRERVQQLDGCCRKDSVDTDGFGPYQAIRIDAPGVVFEVFVTEILSLRFKVAAAPVPAV